MVAQAVEVLLNQLDVSVKCFDAVRCCRPAVGQMSAMCNLEQGYKAFVRGLNVFATIEVGEDLIEGFRIQ